MWVLFLSFLACNPNKNMENDVDVPNGETKAGDVTAPLPEGALRVATRPAEDEAWPERKTMKSTRPTTALIQSDCYSRPESDLSVLRGRPMGGSGGPPPSAAPSPRPQRAPSMKPMKGGEGGMGAADRGAGRMTPDAAASAPMDAGPMAGAPMAEAEPMAPPPPAERAEKKAEYKADAKPKGEEAKSSSPLADSVASSEAEEDADDRFGRAVNVRPEPVIDWGATVYLSNDDSMSLASAQRVLWAVDQGKSFSAREVRPHELLNYFSFDTVPVPEAQLFSVLGSAEQNGDTLSVALAVQGAMPARQPLDLTLVIDRSGSMRAEGRMEYVRKGLLSMTDQLQDGDRIDLTLFDSSVCSPLQNFVVGRDDPSVLTDAIRAIQPRGSTDLDGGLREGYRIQSARTEGDVHGRNRRILLLTDAFLNSGNVNESLVSEIGKRFDEDGIRVTGVGVGREFNDKMLDLITEKGKGAYVYLGSEAVVDRVFGSGFDSLVQTIAHDVRFSIDLPDTLAMERFYGEEASTNPEDVQPINYYAGTSQVFLQDLKIKQGAMKPSDKVTFKVAYRDAVTGEPGEQVFHTTVGLLLDGDTHNLDKAQALMKWTDLLSARAMGDRQCEGLREYRRAASQVQGDAEIAYVSTLTGKLCGVDMSQTVAATGVSFKVKLDADIPIPEVQLACSGEVQKDALSASDTVARFEDVVPGSCNLILQGNVPMRASVEVPATGGDVRCLVRGGRVSCD
ncbi:MAG: VWA domain-containing protein [Myxococcota bacterium]